MEPDGVSKLGLQKFIAPLLFKSPMPPEEVAGPRLSVADLPAELLETLGLCPATADCGWLFCRQEIDGLVRYTSALSLFLGPLVTDSIRTRSAHGCSADWVRTSPPLSPPLFFLLGFACNSMLCPDSRL